MESGVLSFVSSLSLRVTWSIPDFLELSRDCGYCPFSPNFKWSGYSLYSPEFTFDCDRYSLRLLRIGDGDFRLQELNDVYPGRVALYEIQVKSGSEEIDTFPDITDEQLSRSSQTTLHLKRVDETDRYFPGGTLTLLCSMRLREPGSRVNPMSVRSHRIKLLPLDSGRMRGFRMTLPSRDQTSPIRQYGTIGKLSSESFPFLYVTWTIPGYFLPSERYRYRVSPEFSFCGRRYSLRLFPKTLHVAIQLGNLTDKTPGRYASYEIGLRLESGEEISLGGSGASVNRTFYISPRELDWRGRDYSRDDPLIVFCCMRSREPSSAGNSGGAETPGSKVPVPRATSPPRCIRFQTSDEEEDEKGLPETANGVSRAIQTEIPESVSCEIQTEVPDSVSCAIQTDVPDSRTNQRYFRYENGSSLDTKGVDQYDYRYLLLAA